MAFGRLQFDMTNPAQRAMGSYQANTSNIYDMISQKMQQDYLQQMAPYQEEAARLANELSQYGVQQAAAEAPYYAQNAKSGADMNSAKLAAYGQQQELARQMAMMEMQEARQKQAIMQYQLDNPELMGGEIGKKLFALKMLGAKSPQGEEGMYGGELQEALRRQLMYDMLPESEKAAQTAYQKQIADLEAKNLSNLEQSALAGGKSSQDYLSMLNIAKNAYNNMGSYEKGYLMGNSPAITPNAQLFESAVNRMTLDLLPQMKGALSENDLKFLQSQNLNRKMSEGGVEKVFDYLNRVANRANEYSNFVYQASQEGKSSTQIQKEWNDYIAKTPLFSPLEMSDDELANLSDEEFKKLKKMIK